MASNDKAATATATATGTGTPQAMVGIAHPGLDDVMFGRGGDTNYHIGNHRFRVLADGHRTRYRSSSSRKEKAVVVQELVRIWRDRGGRFLTKTDPEKGDESQWHDVGDQVARKKAAKILSEKAPQASTDNEKDNTGKKNSTNSGNNKKRPAVESVDADRVVKQPTLQPAAAAGGPVSLTTTLTTASAVAHVFPHGAPPPQQQQQQQVQPPVVPAPASQLQLPSLQLPRTTPLAPPCQQALTAATQELSSNLALIRSLQGNDPLTNPLVLAALGLVSPATDSASSQLTGLTALLAAQVQRNEQDAARSRSLLARALLVDRLRAAVAANTSTTSTTTTTVPTLPPTVTTNSINNQPSISTIIAAARLGLTTEELQRQLLSFPACSFTSPAASPREEGGDGK